MINYKLKPPIIVIKVDFYLSQIVNSLNSIIKVIQRAQNSFLNTKKVLDLYDVQ